MAVSGRCPVCTATGSPQLRPEGAQALREAVGERVQIRERVAAHRCVLILEHESEVVPARAARVRDHRVERDVGALRNPDPPRVVRLVAVEVGAGRDGSED